MRWADEPWGPARQLEAEYEQLARHRRRAWLAKYLDEKPLRRKLGECVYLDHGAGALEGVSRWSRLQWENWSAELLDSARATVDGHFRGVVRAVRLKLESVRVKAEQLPQMRSDAKATALRELAQDLFDQHQALTRLQHYCSHNLALCRLLLKECRELRCPESICHGTMEDVKALAFHAKLGRDRSPGECEDVPAVLDLLSEVLELSESLGFDVLGFSAQRRAHSQFVNYLGCFLFGVLSMCWLTILVLKCKAPTSPYFSWEAQAATQPVFRLSTMLSVLLWTTAVVVFAFEKYHINYRIILNVDPALTLRAKDICVFALFQTGVWTFGELIYLLDFKFGLVFASLTACGAYPVIQAFMTFSLWLTPTRIAPRLGKARMHLWACFLSVVFACRHEVTFASNLLGDVLTSFTKPLNDLVYTTCYAYKASTFGIVDPAHIQLLCTPWLKYYKVLIILDLPFFFRLVQCCKRYRRTQDAVHLLNAGKYSTSLLVSLVAFVDWKSWGWSGAGHRGLLISVSFAATVYSTVWDLHKDWGLLPGWPRYEGFLRRREQEMGFSPKAYRVAAVADAVCRSTWATSLIPNRMILSAAGLEGQGNLVLVLAVIEVVRRGGWAILRMEYEEKTNASQYRHQIWLPPLQIEEEEHTSHSLPLPALEKAPNRGRLRRAYSCEGNDLSVPLLAHDYAFPNRINTRECAGVTLASQSLATAMYPDCALTHRTGAAPKTADRSDRSTKAALVARSSPCTGVQLMPSPNRFMPLEFDSPGADTQKVSP